LEQEVSCIPYIYDERNNEKNYRKIFFIT